MHLLVEIEGALKITAERLLHHDPGEGATFPWGGAAMGGQRLGHQAKHGGHRGQVVDAVPGSAIVGVCIGQQNLQLIEGVRVVVLACDVAEPIRHRPPPRTGIGGGSGDLSSEVGIRPLRPGHADDGEPGIEDPAVD